MNSEKQRWNMRAVRELEIETFLNPVFLSGVGFLSEEDRLKRRKYKELSQSAYFPTHTLTAELRKIADEIRNSDQGWDAKYQSWQTKCQGYFEEHALKTVTDLLATEGIFGLLNARGNALRRFRFITPGYANLITDAVQYFGLQKQKRITARDEPTRKALEAVLKVKKTKSK